MFKTFTKSLCIAVIGGATFISASALQTAPGYAQACGWYAIGGCFRGYNSAQNRAINIGAEVIDTGQYPNFRNGYFCAATGPWTKSKAGRERSRFKRSGVSDAYRKRAC